MTYLRGENFRTELEKEDVGHEPLIDEFIYKGTTTMIYAKPGQGKSVVTANIAIGALTKGLVFDYLPSRIKRIAYWQTEGSRDEQLGRIKAMENEYGALDCSKLSWHTTFIQIENQRTWSVILKELDEVKPFDLLIIDPIYALTTEGLVNEKFCGSLRGFNDKVRNDFGASILMNNHTPKDILNYKGQKVEKDVPMGMQWLEGNVDGMYYFKKTSNQDSYLECRKDRSNGLIEKLSFKFDIANWSLKALSQDSSMTAKQKVKLYLKKKFANNSISTSEEICRECNISRRHLRRLKADGTFDDFTSFSGSESNYTWCRSLS